MTSEPRMRDDCLDPQLLAAFAERNLKRGEMPEVLAHLETCPRCMSALTAALDLMEPRKHTYRWLAAAAAIVVVIGSAPFIQRAMRSSPTGQLAALVPTSERVVEPRLSGGFAWAPFRAPVRSAEGDSGAQRMKLVGAAGELVERANTDKSAAAQHAAGIGLVLIERPEDAIERLRLAAEQSTADARAWSDLAAAEYMAALRQGRASLYPVALAHADRALRADPNCAEALFNRALILERLGLTQAAREAWDRYLRVDSSSQWAAEAREHLQGLAASTGESLFRGEQPAMEAAAARGEQAAVDAFVDRHRQQSRAWGEAQYLGLWAEAALRHDDAAGARPLAVARALGGALARASGESMLRDAVVAIDRASPAQRARIASALATYRRGRIAYSRREVGSAERDLRKAAAEFAAADHPMARMARYYAANARFDQNDVATARRELELLRAEADAVPGHRALGAHVRWELGLCTMLDGDWSATATLASEAEQTFRELGEKSHLAFMQMMWATALISLGRPDEGWAQRAKAFAVQSAQGYADLLPVSIGDAARIELRMGNVDAARALLAIEDAAHRANRDEVQISNVLVRRSVVDAMVGENAEAAKSAREAMTAAQRIGDSALRARAVADANFAAGATALRQDPRRARELLSLAIDHYRGTDKSFYLPEAWLLRARASLRIGDGDNALTDLSSGIEEVERHRSLVAGPLLGTGVLDARRALFDESIALRLDRGDRAGAFADADHAHGRLSWSGERTAGVAELQAKLAGSGTAVLQLVVLPREVVAFCVTAKDVVVARQSIPRDAVAALARRNDDDAFRALHDLLIRPSGAALAGARQVIVIADAVLQQVAFAALIDSASGRPLIETMAVAMALSASTLQPETRTPTRQTLFAIALPSGERTGMVALGEQLNELADVARGYGRASELPSDGATFSAFAAGAASAGVVHVAGHTARQSETGDLGLLFRGAGVVVEPVTWSRIASMKLAGTVVVLAACETLRVPAAPHAQSMSLGGGFLAAGAGAVIGTLAPIPDNDSRRIFRAVHRELARGESAAVALQRAYVEAIAHEPQERRAAWRSIAVLTRTIARH